MRGGKPAVRNVFLAVCFVLLWGTAYGHEIFVNAGLTRDTGTSTDRFQWAVSYLHEIGQHTAFSFSYINEGHQPSNHRDGVAGQIWARTQLQKPRLVLGLGIGPYVYFDTHIHGDGSHHDLHGLAGIASGTVTWHGLAPFLIQGRVNYLVANKSFDTLSATIGVGYELDASVSSGRAPAGNRGENRNEITAYYGEAVLNSARSERQKAWSFEYRRNVARYMDLSAAWLWEGDKRPLDRYGIVAQFWLVHPFFDDRLTLAAGIGPYLAYDKYRLSGGGVTKIEGDIAFRASYRFWGNLAAVASWSRIFSTHDRDSDVFLGGLGYRF